MRDRFSSDDTYSDDGVDHQLFILWEHGREYEDRIIDELSKRFIVKRVVRVSWSREFAGANFRRFYGKTPDSRMAKLGQVGDGAFLAIVVEDLHPAYGFRVPISGGYRFVNTRIFDTKQLFRAWMRGRNLIHCTVEPVEFVRDMTLLFGPDYPKRFRLEGESNWDGVIEDFREDIIGARGWTDFTELFDVLNGWAEYVVLRNFDEFDRFSEMNENWDVDILCRDFSFIAAALNGRKSTHLHYQPSFQVIVGGREVKFDLRHIGDDYLDGNWQQEILSRRVLYRNQFYVPNRKDHFFTLLYHSSLHKRVFWKKHTGTLMELATLLDIEQIHKHYAGENERYAWYNDRKLIAYVISQFLLGGGRKFTFPDDLSLPLRYSIIQRLDRRVRPSVLTYLLVRPVRKRWARLRAFVSRLSRPGGSRPSLSVPRRRSSRSYGDASKTVQLEGTVASGRGVASFHLARASKVLERLLGRPPVEGSFNIILARPVELALDRVAVSVDGSHLFWWAELNGHPCFAYRWKGCPLHVIEVVADRHIRNTFKLNNGDLVRLQMDADALRSLPLLRRAAWMLTWRYRESFYYTSVPYVRITKRLGWVRRMSFQRMPKH